MKNRWFPLLLTVVLLAACGKTPGIDGYGHAGLFSLQKNGQGEVVSAEILSGGDIWRCGSVKPGGGLHDDRSGVDGGRRR